MHVQLLAQLYLLTRAVPACQPHAQAARFYLSELQFAARTQRSLYGLASSFFTRATSRPPARSSSPTPTPLRQWRRHQHQHQHQHAILRLLVRRLLCRGRASMRCSSRACGRSWRTPRSRVRTSCLCALRSTLINWGLPRRRAPARSASGARRERSRPARTGYCCCTCAAAGARRGAADGPSSDARGCRAARCRRYSSASPQAAH